MDEGLCGLLSVKAVPLLDKGCASLGVASEVWRSKSSGPPVYGKGLRAALVFARVPRGGGSVPPRARPPRAPQLSEVNRATGVAALISAAGPVASTSPASRPPLLPQAVEAQWQSIGVQQDSCRQLLPRAEESRPALPKAAYGEAWAKTLPLEGSCAESSRPSSPQLSLTSPSSRPPLPARPGIAEDTADEEEESGCEATADDDDDEFGGGHDAVCSSVYAGAEEVLMLSDDLQQEGDLDNGQEEAHDEESELADRDDVAAQSDASSEACDEEVEPEAASQDKPAGFEVSSTPKAVELAESMTLTKKKKKKKRKKKKRRTSSKAGVEEPVLSVKRPPVPRFPHPQYPPGPGEVDHDFLPIAATTVPMTEKSLATLNMKERVPKHLLLGRFARRPLASLLSEGLEEGAARAADGTPSESAGGEPDSSAAAESLGLLLATSETSWAQPARRARSVDGSGARASRKGGNAGDEAGHSLKGEDGSKVGRSRSVGLGGRHRQRNEARGNSDGANEEPLGLSIIGQTAKATKQKSSKNWLVAASIQQKKQAEESGDAALAALYFSFSSMKDEKGQKIGLKNREKVVRVLHELQTQVAIPLCRHFGLRYNFFSEHHCQAKKAGVTVKEPLVLKKQQEDGTVTEETRYLTTIRLRVRVHPTKGDPQSQFISRGTQLAVLLHELCHLKHMNHGKDFMLFLRDIFQWAVARGVIDPGSMTNEIPSPWPWENAIFQRGGQVSNEELLDLFAEHKAQQREKARAAGEESARKAAQEPVIEEHGLSRPAAAVTATEEGSDAPLSAPQDDPTKATAPSDGTSPMPPHDATEILSGTEASPPRPQAGDAEVAPRKRQRLKAMAGTSGSTLNLTEAYQRGSQQKCAEECECCADPDGATAMEYGEDGDIMEFDTSTEAISPMMPRRSRSLSRGRARSKTDLSGGRSLSSSVVKLPQINGVVSPYQPPPRVGSPVRGGGVPTLPPV